MQICINGHKITEFLYSHPEGGQKKCEKCGAKTISKCQFCKTDIRGYHHMRHVAYLSPVPIPEYCKNCGEPYPWQGKIKTGNSQNVEINSQKIVENIFKRFHKVVRQLRKRHEDRVTLDVKDEYDVQDLLHSILKLHFDDVREEVYSHDYAGTSPRMDFVLPDEKIVVETKMTRSSLKNKKLGEELIVDKEYYKKYPDCKILLCLVYDPDGYIDNPKGFEKDISEKNETFTCKVFITP